MLDSCPMKIKGSSTGFDPIHVRRMKLAINSQYSILPIGLKVNPLTLLVWMAGKIARMIMLSTNAITPPNLLGIALSMA